VCDPAGRVVVQKVEADCANLIPAVALAKARTCTGLGASTRALRDKYASAKPTQLAALGNIAGPGEFAPFPGGVLLRDPDNPATTVGAVGISGASADEDEHCAVLAAKAVGLLSEPPDSAL